MAKLSSTDIYGDLYVDGIISGVLSGSVSNNLKIQLNGGTTEGTNQFTFNGSAAKTVNITPSSIGAAASSHNHTTLTGLTSLEFGGIDTSDTMSITTSCSSATSYMDFNMSDDANSDVWRWRFTAWDSASNANAATFNAMTLMATSTTKAKLAVNGSVTADSFNGLNFWKGTQAQYDAISSKSATTVYFITG